VTDPDDVTELLRAWAGGDEDARAAAVASLYESLRRLAHACMRREGEAVTLQTTGLVHEAYLRLAAQRRTEWRSRGHFFAIAARIMRRILVEAYRARRAQKRGGGDPAGRVDIADVDPVAPAPGLDVEGLSEALDRLAAQDPDHARIVELRFFAGLTVEETAEAVSLSPATVKREWALARAWLHRELSGDG